MKRLFLIGITGLFLFSGCLFVEDGPDGTVVAVTPPSTTVIVEDAPPPHTEVIVEDHPVSYTYVEEGDEIDCELDYDPEYCD